ncbi:SLAM family member 8-like [Pelobates fuscus]|uniref:SLAM family member 8-like n=1 Tax=Pelobates fuscus TaxID=191477 RepID=UPI002FE4F379
MYWLTLSLLVQTVVIVAKESTTWIQGTLGGSIHLTPAIPNGFNTRDIYWRHLSSADELVATFSRGSSETTYRSRFYGRVLLLQNSTLEIRDLEVKDMGIFSCLLVDTEGRMKLFKYHLTVYEAVVPAAVKVFVSGDSTNGTECSVFLSCNTTMGSNISYTWRANKLQGELLNVSYTTYDDGRLLSVNLGPTDWDVSYTCTVTNPVSEQHTTVVPWESCANLFGKKPKISSYELSVCMAVVIILAFALLTLCIVLHVKTSGKPKKKGNEEIALKRNEDAVLENEGDVRQQNEEEAHHVVEMRNQEMLEGNSVV